MKVEDEEALKWMRIVMTDLSRGSLTALCPASLGERCTDRFIIDLLLTIHNPFTCHSRQVSSVDGVRI